MASIYSDEMKEKILADFSSKNPKVSASIIERFGENPRNKGIGSLNVEQYRDAVDAPLYMRDGSGAATSTPTPQLTFGQKLKEFIAPEKPDLTSMDVVSLLGNLYKLFTAGDDVETPAKAPRYRAPKPTEIEGVGGIGMNDGEVDGIGGERDDLVPIWASDREYVVSANGVRRMGGGNHARGIAALDEINNDGRLV